MVTDKQFKELENKYEELHRQFARLSRDMAEMQMKMGVRRIEIREEEHLPSKKDITRYKYQGKLLNKRQLVLKCIHKFVQDHPTISYSEIQEVFPDYIQGSLGVIRLAEDAERYKSASGHYYFEDENILLLQDKCCVICKDWTAKNIDRFINIMQSLGEEITVISRN